VEKTISQTPDEASYLERRKNSLSSSIPEVTLGTPEKEKQFKFVVLGDVKTGKTHIL